MLKGTLITLSFILLSSVASAQQQFACQFTNSNGFAFDQGKWIRTPFKLRSPFFIKLGNTLDPESVYDGLDVGFSTQFATCFSKDLFDGSYTCASQIGESVIFNPKTGEGAQATILGAGSEGEERDTMSISTFVCQQM